MIYDGVQENSKVAEHRLLTIEVGNRDGEVMA